MKIPFLKLERVFKIRVVYKSGYTHDFECTRFKVTKGVNTEFDWEALPGNNPLMFGANDVAAVWQIGHRLRIAKQ